MTEDQVINETFDPNEGDDNSAQKVQVGLHPLGGIGVTVTGPDGTTATARLGIEEAWILEGQVQALASFLVGSAYAAAMQREQVTQKIVVPGGMGR